MSGTSYALIGDSQGVGVRAALGAALTARGDRLAWTAVETGASLSALAGKARSLPTGPEAPDVVLVVSGGGNDSSATDAPERWAQAVRAVVSSVRARAPRASIVWAGPVPATEHDAALRKRAVYAQLPPLLASLDVRWLDGFDLAAGLAPGRDGIHYSADSYRTIASRLASALVRAGGPSVLAIVGASLAGLAFIGAGAFALARARARR